ncbi:MAG TPA: formimidoylglutamate deiminase [Longimicrobiales bacterium]|nr:formimidoylglutamate deiminase [Longimicrobiales bacterium]
MPILLPELLYVDGAFRRGLGVDVDADTGRIVRVGAEAELLARGNDDLVAGGPAAELVPGAAVPEYVPGGPQLERLPGRALLPGFVNAHSHAFQRLIRGRTQWRPADAPEADFWSWREAMYAATLALTPEDVLAVSRFCFLEMLRAGTTTVGEFHYLHRDRDGSAYADPNELALRVVDAAREVGIRIVLLDVAYATGGVGEPLRPEQRRFATPDLDAFLSQVWDLRAAVKDDPLVTVGLAPHSVRAVPREWLRPAAEWAAAHALPLHMHVSEQAAEVRASRAGYGLAPVELLDAEGVLSPTFTGVHATHVSESEIQLLGETHSTVCACPTTERDLGDGFLPGAALRAAGVAIAVGSDSQTVLDPLEEIRLLEYNERLRRERRVLLTEPRGERLEVAPVLLAAGTSAGARALGLDAGRLRAGACADLVAIDLEHPTLAGWTDDSLAATLALCAPADVVCDVWVAGVRRVDARRHALERDALEAFRRVAGRGVPTPGEATPSN